LEGFCLLNKVGIDCFQETKLAIVNDGVLRSLVGPTITNWSNLHAHGSSRGMLIG